MAAIGTYNPANPVSRYGVVDRTRKPTGTWQGARQTPSTGRLYQQYPHAAGFQPLGTYGGGGGQAPQNPLPSGQTGQMGLNGPIRSGQGNQAPPTGGYELQPFNQPSQNSGGLNGSQPPGTGGYDPPPFQTPAPPSMPNGNGAPLYENSFAPPQTGGVKPSFASRQPLYEDFGSPMQIDGIREDGGGDGGNLPGPNDNGGGPSGPNGGLPPGGGSETPGNGHENPYGCPGDQVKIDLDADGKQGPEVCVSQEEAMRRNKLWIGANPGVPGEGQPGGPGGNSGGGGGGGVRVPANTPFTPYNPGELPAAPGYTPPTYTPPTPYQGQANGGPGYTGQNYEGMGQYNAPELNWNGQFNAPQLNWDREFKAPSYEEAMNDPGYQFRLKQGQQALENNAASRGTLRTGATLKGLADYNQQAASQEYQNVYNRAANTYDRQFGTAKDIYGANYQGAQDEYNTDYASALQNYNSARQGALDEYGTDAENMQNTWANNRQNNLDQYQAGQQNWQNTRQNNLDVYGLNAAQAQQAFENTSRGSEAALQAAQLGYQTQSSYTQRMRELEMQRRWQEWLHNNLSAESAFNGPANLR